MLVSKNKNLTLTEAEDLYKSVGMKYPNTEHNRKMMAKVVHNHLRVLQGKV